MCRVTVLICLLTTGNIAPAMPAEVFNVLEPADTTSPRSTLQGFIRVMDERYGGLMGDGGFITHYLQSGRLFPDERQYQQTVELIQHGRAISAKYLDLSALPPATLEQTAWRLTIQLKEILDRIELPPDSAAPDAVTMQSRTFKRWTVPGSEIHIGLIESGPRAGEYLFTQETVRQIPAFYERIKDQPYKGGHVPGMYDFVFGFPTGLAMTLHAWVPLRWMLDLPGWTMRSLFGQPLWRWVGIVMLGGGALGIFWLCLRLGRRARRNRSDTGGLLGLLPALSLLLLAPALLYIMGDILRVTPNLYEAMAVSLSGLFYLALTWLVWDLGRLTADWFINNERVRRGSTDSPLIRLAGRLVSLALALGILIEGANRVGLPAYSVVAGLGIGGLAMALAGQQALTNLFGSLIIMFEKPFRIGHSIRTAGIEGRVEDIGFRSTRLRTPENTLIIVPSSELIRHTLENLSLRKMWRIKRTLHLKLSTPVSQLRAFQASVEALLQAHEDVIADTVKVALTQIGLHGYELLVDYAIRAPDDATQRRKNGKLLAAIASLAEQHQIAFEQTPP